MLLTHGPRYRTKRSPEQETYARDHASVLQDRADITKNYFGFGDDSLNHLYSSLTNQALLDYVWAWQNEQILVQGTFEHGGQN